MNKFKPIHISGDHHGNYEQLFKLINKYEIQDCYLISVGDIGIGFKNNRRKELRAINIYNDFFQARNIHFMSIRGNHDDPAYFDGSINLSNFRLLPDYHYENINGEIFLFVGGATSIDRKIRTLNVSYWTDEAFVLKPELISPCDVLISHSVPNWNGPNNKSGIESWCLKDPTLWEECMAERSGHDKLIELCRPKRHYAGHMHISSTVTMNGCISKILDEMEFTEHRYENY